MSTIYELPVKSELKNETLTVPMRKLAHPNFDNLLFDVYQTSKMYLSVHITSDDPDPNHHWPDSCLNIGWERYYSDSYEETNWQHLESSGIVPLSTLSFHPASCALHYGASIFEGTKAHRSNKGHIVLFRAEDNAKRFQASSARLLMPKVPIDVFVESVAETALANADYIPPFNPSNWGWKTRHPRFLYLRPLLAGHGPQLGVRPAKDHLFVIYSSPVRAYYPVEGMRVLITTEFHRAAPGGTGHAKSASNYVPGLLPTQLARHGYDWQNNKPVKVSDEAFNDVLYLDPIQNKYIEEFSGANFLAVTTDGTLVNPVSDTILPGVTRDSIITLAKDLGIAVESRPLGVDEVMDSKRIAEAFCVGNAAIVNPIYSVYYKGETRTFDVDNMKTANRLWDMLTGIQLQTREDPYGWVKEIG